MPYLFGPAATCSLLLLYHISRASANQEPKLTGLLEHQLSLAIARSVTTVAYSNTLEFELSLGDVISFTQNSAETTSIVFQSGNLLSATHRLERTQRTTITFLDIIAVAVTRSSPTSWQFRLGLYIGSNLILYYNSAGVFSLLVSTTDDVLSTIITSDDQVTFRYTSETKFLNLSHSSINGSASNSTEMAETSSIDYVDTIDVADIQVP